LLRGCDRLRRARGQAGIRNDDRGHALQPFELVRREQAAGEDPTDAVGLCLVEVPVTGVVHEVDLSPRQQREDVEPVRGNDAAGGPSRGTLGAPIRASTSTSSRADKSSTTRSASTRALRLSPVAGSPGSLMTSA
jgi:hypothetical protein